MIHLGLEAGLQPSEIERLTPYGVLMAYRAHRERMLDFQEMLAWTQANLLNAWTKKTITTRKIFKRPPKHWAGESLDNG